MISGLPGTAVKTVHLFITAENAFGKSEPFSLFIEVKEEKGEEYFHQKCRKCGAIAVPKNMVCTECGFDNRQKVVPVEVCKKCGEDKESCVCDVDEVVGSNVLASKVISVASNLRQAGNSEDEGEIKRALETASDDIDGILSEIDD